MESYLNNDRRKLKRISSSLSISIVNTKSQQAIIRGQTISLSKSGILFKTLQVLAKHDDFFDLKLDQHPNAKFLVKIVKHNDQSMTYFGEFADQSKESLIALERIMDNPTAPEHNIDDRRKFSNKRRIVFKKIEQLLAPNYQILNMDRVTISNINDATKIEAALINISQTGMCISTQFKSDIGSNVIVHVSYQGRSYEINGVVRWAEQYGGESRIYGVEISNKEVGVECLNDLLFDIVTVSLNNGLDEQSKSTGEKVGNEKIIRIPHDDRYNYDEAFVEKRRKWLEKMTNSKYKHISHYSVHPNDVRGNIENFVGVAQIPIGLVGPIRVKGDHANDIFYVPLATTEGALITTYQRGAIAITKSGGARARIVRDSNYLDPVFIVKSGDEASKLVKWIEDHQSDLHKKVQQVTKHGKLLEILPVVIGRRVVLKVSYTTEDAMGANMINLATESICRYVREQFKIERYILRSNYSSEKKASGANLITNYGKEVYVEVTIPKRIVKLHLNTSSEEIAKAWHSWALGSINAGVLGMSAQIANGVSGIFIACGQDVAHVANASVGIIMFESVNGGDLYAALKLPNIIVGTVGGGTALGTQRECLETIGCYGNGKAKKFAEIVAATVLAGEIGICAGLTSEEFLAPHVKASLHTREKAYKDGLLKLK